MRRLFSFVLLSLVFISFPFFQVDSALAQTSAVDRIQIDVTIHEDGSADFVEVWEGEFYDVTELYFTKENLSKTTFEDFSVRRNGEPYEFVDNWNIDASLEEKAYKNGIRKMKDGVELNWGLSEPGPAEFVLSYRVTNFIKQAKDSQFVHWTFSNPEFIFPRSNIIVNIDSFKDFSKEGEKIWSFGYDGEVEFVNGHIRARSYSALDQDDYVMLLIQFEDGTFTAEDKINQKFKKIQKAAFKGSDYNQGFFSQLFEKIGNFIKVALGFLVFGFILFLTWMNKGSFSGQKPRKFKRKFKEEYYRDYPYEGYYLESYHIVYLMGLGNFNTILTSLLLKWMKEEKIRTSEETSGMFRKKVQHIYFLSDDVKKDSAEGRLFHSIKGLVTKEGYVTDRQIASWAERNHKSLRTWEDGLRKTSLRKLTEEGFIRQTEKKVLFFKSKQYELTDSGEKLEENVYKYVNYLHDFSLLSEQDAINVHLWDEIMIWAAYLDLTDVVSEQFKKIYPKYHDESKYGHNGVRRTRDIATAAAVSRRKAERAARRRARRGEGGVASRRGGGTSYGGGKGGGGR